MTGTGAGADFEAEVLGLAETARRLAAGTRQEESLRGAAARLDAPLTALVAGGSGQDRAQVAEALRLRDGPGPPEGWVVTEYDAGDVDALLAILDPRAPGGSVTLEPFEQEPGSRVPAVATLGLVPRAESLTPSRVDSLSAARAVAAGLRDHPVLRAVLVDVLPVSARLAQAARGLDTADHEVVAAVAARPLAEQQEALLSVDRWLDGPPPEQDGTSRAARAQVLDRLGLPGLRLAVGLVGSGACPDAARLSAELLRRSGLPALRSHLQDRVADRARALRAGAVLREVAAVVPELGATADRLSGEVERIVTTARALREAQLLEDLVTGEVRLRPADRRAAEALLGRDGHGLAERLRLPPGASAPALTERLVDELARWQRLGENPLAERSAKRAAGLLRHVCEGLIADR